MLIVDPEFYAINKDILEQIRSEQIVEFIYVPNEERARVPANFLVLPDNKILMGAGTPETNKNLASIIGEGKIITTANPIDHLLADGFGIRCITNLINYK